MKITLRIKTNCFQTVKKALLVMKLTFVLMLAGILQVSANVNGQTKVSLNLNHVEIARALNAIEKQGTYRFLYNSRLSDIGKRVNISVTDGDIDNVLQRMFEGT